MLWTEKTPLTARKQADMSSPLEQIPRQMNVLATRLQQERWGLGEGDRTSARLSLRALEAAARTVVECDPHGAVLRRRQYRGGVPPFQVKLMGPHTTRPTVDEMR